MERIALTIKDGGAGAGAQHGGAGREANLIFVLPLNVYVGPPPVGGTFWFQIFIQASSPEIWSETISGGEEVLAGKWGGLFWATSLEKIIGGVTAIVSYRPGPRRWTDCRLGVDRNLPGFQGWKPWPSTAPTASNSSVRSPRNTLRARPCMRWRSATTCPVRWQ